MLFKFQAVNKLYPTLSVGHDGNCEWTSPTYNFLQTAGSLPRHVRTFCILPEKVLYIICHEQYQLHAQ